MAVRDQRLDGAGVAGTGVSVNDNPSLDISLGYMFTDNWAVELLADLSSPHTVSAQGLGGFSVPDGTDVVDTNVLPPTVFLQYQFNPARFDHYHCSLYRGWLKSLTKKSRQPQLYLYTR